MPFGCGISCVEELGGEAERYECLMVSVAGTVRAQRVSGSSSALEKVVAGLLVFGFSLILDILSLFFS